MNYIKTFESYNSDKFINHIKGKYYMSGDNWVVYADKEGGNISIGVNNMSGWSIDPHRHLGLTDVFRLMSNGKLLARVTLPKGGFSKTELANNLFNIAEKEIGNKYFTKKEYEDIITLYYDMLQDFQKPNYDI